MVTKNILEQYAQTREEIRFLEKRIENKKKQLAKIRSEGQVIDMVKGGYGGTQHFKIEGIPRGTINLVEAQLENQEFILTCRYNKLMEQETRVEQYISDMPTSELRLVSTYRFIDGLEWNDVAKKMGPGYTATGTRLLMTRYMNKTLADDIDVLIQQQDN